MNRKMLERLTKEELIELVMRQERVINSLDSQRYESNSVIEHLVEVAVNMEDIWHNDLKRDHALVYLSDYIREMQIKYPMYLVRTETGEYKPQEELNERDNNGSGNSEEA